MERTAVEHIEGYCRFRNDGYTAWPGPRAVSKPGEDVHSEANADDVKSFNLVTSAMGKIGKDSRMLVRLLDHIYLMGEDISTFRLFGAGGSIPAEVKMLGYSVSDLLEIAHKRAIKAVKLEIEQWTERLAS